MGRKKITMCGLDRAIAKAGSVYNLALALEVSPSTLQRWRKEDPAGALRRAIAKAGSQVALARLLGTAQKTVCIWAARDMPPPPRPASKNAVDRAVALAGSQAKLAAVLGVSQQNVGLWVKQGYVPATRAKEIEIQFGLPRAELLSPRIRSAAGLGEDL